jgi:hypothetical protein
VVVSALISALAVWIVRASDYTPPPEGPVRLALPTGSPHTTVGQGACAHGRGPIERPTSLDGAGDCDEPEDDEETLSSPPATVDSLAAPLGVRRIIPRPELEAPPPLFLTLLRFRC